jgi:hypothetical protein
MNSLTTPLKKFKMKGFIHVIWLLYQAHKWLSKTQQKGEILKKGDDFIIPL